MIKNMLSPESRVWIYQSIREFNQGEAEIIAEKLDKFIFHWTSHRERVVGDGALLYNRFVVLMADEQKISVGGCSVDSSVHFIKNLQKEFDTNFFDRWNIAYIENGVVKSCNREEFGKLVTSNAITHDTTVFNNLVQTKLDFETKWKIPYRESWLKNLQTTNTPLGSVL